jgi:RNA polymerase sigma-70 factor (ECF subfamily)
LGSAARERADAVTGARQRQALYERLARRHYAGVYNYLCWISRNTALAEDLTQETFVQIWRHLPEVRSEKAVRVWVYRVARNTYLQDRRRTGLDTVSLEDCGEAEPAGPPEAQPDLRVERDELRRLVQAAVADLPDAYREVIVLHNLEDLSLAQVGDVLQVPVGTVKSRRARAFRRLRELLQEVAR